MDQGRAEIIDEEASRMSFWRIRNIHRGVKRWLIALVDPASHEASQSASTSRAGTQKACIPSW